jgi:methylmalonyl-CoA carboxyltransferase large subunit
MAASEIELIREQLAALTERLARLEAAGAPPVEAKPVAEPVRTEAPEPISEETLIAISAAVAAFLGERARIRKVRIISSPAWAQQGRVSIQASHRLER